MIEKRTTGSAVFSVCNHILLALIGFAIVDFADSVFFGKEIQNNTVRFVETKEAVPEQLKCALQKMDWRNDKLHYSWPKP